jgi:hypothetical protein
MEQLDFKLSQLKLLFISILKDYQTYKKKSIQFLVYIQEDLCS